MPSERTKSWLVIERLPEGKKGVPREVEGVETKVEATRARPGVCLCNLPTKVSPVSVEPGLISPAVARSSA